LSQTNVQEWEQKAGKDPVLALSRTILSHTDISATLLKREANIADQHVFNLTLPYTATPITNQKSSGRCWLFASTNVVRYTAAQKLSVADFQLSQSYLFFWDKLEKSNYYLELSIELAAEPLDSRIVSHLAQECGISDGGQYDMVANLFERYGVVPQPIFPESFASSASGRMDALLRTKLREHGLALRRLDAALRSSPEILSLPYETANAARLNALRKKKEEFMQEIYNILTVSLGVPPLPDHSFTYEYTDKDGKARSWTGTPREFYKQFSSEKFPPTEGVSLINDPRNEYGKLYTVDKLGNVWGGRDVAYVNTTIGRMKEAVVATLKAGQPFFFGCDVGKFSNTPLGIMDLDLFDYERALGIKFTSTKADRLQTGESAMTHAMVITAVHLDADGKPVRYKVENSWGDAVGDQGFFVMTDRWFDEFVYQVVIPRPLLPKDLIKVLDDGNPIVLPAWDPMGSLA
jgi:bleomycin hydrolase